MIEMIIIFLLSNFTLTFLILGFVASGIMLLRAKKPLLTSTVVEALFAYFLLFSIGFSFLYNFFIKILFPEMAAAFIGWEVSPFQTEVAFASLGFAIVGLLAFRGSFGLRIGAVVGPAFFLLGAAGGHIYEMITVSNFSPGNAGVIFYTDIFIPLLGFTFLWLQHKFSTPAQTNNRTFPYSEKTNI